MPIDLTGLIESIQDGFGQIPPVAIALALLAGPTAALIAYRLISVARRRQTPIETAATPLWVCPDCRSVNELRLWSCYRCGMGRDTTEELEVLFDEPAGPQVAFDIPAGSPFAALAGSAPTSQDHSQARGPGVPVLFDRPAAREAVAVGPGRSVGADARDAMTAGERGRTIEAGAPVAETDLVFSSERDA